MIESIKYSLMCNPGDLIIIITIVILFILQIYMSIAKYNSLPILIVMAIIILCNGVLQYRINRRRDEAFIVFLNEVEPSIDLKTIKVQQP